MRYIVIILIIFSAFFIGCWQKQESGLPTASDVKLESLNGSSIDLTDYKGKTIFLNFWASWCKPCLREMPTIEKAISILKDDDIIFLFASNEELETIKTFQNKKDFRFQYVQVVNAEALNIQVWPTTFIFDGNGTLVFTDEGSRDWSTQESISLIRNEK